MKKLVFILVTLLALFMVATVIIAVWQQSLGWGWWWVVPLGAGFVVLVIVFRVLMQHADDRAQLLDAELDRLEQDTA